MSVVNKMPYLRTSREFPEDIHQVTVELNKSYIDTANAVNDRIIGIFPIVNPAITGESWFLKHSRKQQTLREVFILDNAAAIATPLTHHIKLQSAAQFTRCWGSYTDGTKGYGLLWASSVPIAGQITFDLTTTQIEFHVDGAAPTFQSGRVILEWLAEL